MRARNIKPSFFKNDDLGECHPYVRLLFIGLWCMSYKDGIVEYRPKRIKAEIFPYDDGKCDVEKFLEQLAKFNFISILEENGTGNRLILINNFVKHQSPHQNEKSSGYDDLSNYQVISGNSTKFISPLMNDECGMMNDEGGKRNEETSAKLTPCPHQQIINLYHEMLPELPQVKTWTNTRKTLLQGRWKENPSISWWTGYFNRIKDSDFLTGKVEVQNGRPPFLANLEWIIKPANMVKIIEGKYDNRVQPAQEKSEHGRMYSSVEETEAYIRSFQNVR